MKTKYRNRIVFAACVLMMQMICVGSAFQMEAQTNLFSPSTFVVNAHLTDKASLQGKWQVEFTVYIDKELVRKQSLEVTRKEPAVLKLDFPELRKVVNGRCRAELYLDGEFIEGVEKKIRIWPRAVPYEISDNQMVIWAYDKSGSLQKVFKSINIKAVDAMFQTARNFSKPDVIFVGENTDPGDLQVINKHVMVSDNKPMIVFLAQKEFHKNALLKVCKFSKNPGMVSCDKKAGLLKGLGKFNIVNMIAEARPVSFRTDLQKKTPDVASWVAKVPSKGEGLKSYAGLVTEQGHKMIYCQFPVMKGIAGDPAPQKLLFNLLDLAVMQASTDSSGNNDDRIDNINRNNKKERNNHE